MRTRMADEGDEGVADDRGQMALLCCILGTPRVAPHPRAIVKGGASVRATHWRRQLDPGGRVGRQGALGGSGHSEHVSGAGFGVPAQRLCCIVRLKKITKKWQCGVRSTMRLGGGGAEVRGTACCRIHERDRGGVCGADERHRWWQGGFVFLR